MRWSLFVLVLAACGSRPSTPAAPARPPAKPLTCVVGQFASAMEDDGHGVSVKLSAARSSATGYQPLAEEQFYVHDKGNPTRGLQVGDEVWLIENDQTFPFRYLTAEQAKAQCPAPP